MALSFKDPQDGDIAEISDINVTPFIDVILVLLIIFMVAAPLSAVDVPVELPVSNAQPQPRPDKPIFLTIKSDLSLVIGNGPAPRETLQAVLDQHTGHDREQRIFLRTDSTVAYRELMSVMNLLRDAGYLKIALVGLEDAGQSNGAASPSAAGAPAPSPASGAPQPRHRGAIAGPCEGRRRLSRFAGA
jgi:biopolymer transport protein ExbD